VHLFLYVFPSLPHRGMCSLVQTLLHASPIGHLYSGQHCSDLTNLHIGDGGRTQSGIAQLTRPLSLHLQLLLFPSMQPNSSPVLYALPLYRHPFMHLQSDFPLASFSNPRGQNMRQRISGFLHLQISHPFASFSKPNGQSILHNGGHTTFFTSIASE